LKYKIIDIVSNNKKRDREKEEKQEEIKRGQGVGKEESYRKLELCRKYFNISEYYGKLHF